jgi:hypothetical protein
MRSNASAVASRVCAKPFLALEQGAKRQGNLPTLGAGRKRAGVSQGVAPVLDEFGLAVERMVKRQCTSNRRHGSHLSRISVTVMQVMIELVWRSQFPSHGQNCSEPCRRRTQMTHIPNQFRNRLCKTGNALNQAQPIGHDDKLPQSYMGVKATRLSSEGDLLLADEFGHRP